MALTLRVIRSSFKEKLSGHYSLLLTFCYEYPLTLFSTSGEEMRKSIKGTRDRATTVVLTGPHSPSGLILFLTASELRHIIAVVQTRKLKRSTIK